MEEGFVKLNLENALLEGNLLIPQGAKAIVVFAHGSGSSRHSPRNQFVAEVLRSTGLGTLLIDLLTEEEELVDRQTAHLRFDIELLTARMVAITRWLLREKGLKIGYFGASTGTAAALQAASQQGEAVFAVVSRGGRPDLAGKRALSRVKGAVLLIVGGEDYPVVEMNQEALRELKCEKQLVIVPKATHLFEEPGTLEEVAELAATWFSSH